MQSMIEYGVSQSLRAEFDMLRETSSIHSYKYQQTDNVNKGNIDWQNKKYSAKTIDKLAQYVVCRNYGKACLELAYLCWPIVRHQEYSNGLLHFFWIEEALSPNRFKQAMGTLAGADITFPSVSINSNGLQVGVDKHSFTVSTSRVALLSALLELLVSNIEGILDCIEAHLSSSDSACVGKLASELQKKLYNFLKDHLPTANLQHKYRYIHHWVSSNTSPENLNDEQVLAFWKSAIHEEGYVKFQNAVSDMIDFRFAHEQVSVQRELRYDISLDDMSASEAGQLHQSVFELTKEEVGSTSWLMEVPKFVSKKEYQQVAFLFEYMAGVKQFPLSIMRAEVFGQWQNVFIQQSRNNNASELIAPSISYTDYLASLQEWRNQAVNTILCCSAVLLENKDVRCLTLLSLALGLMHDQEKSQSFKALVQRLMQSKTQSEPTISDLNRWLLQSQTLNQFFSLAKKALAKNNKMGFKSADISTLQSDELAIYERGGEQLNICVDVIVEYCEGVATKVQSMEDETQNLGSFFRSDLFIFKDEFEKRHGDINEE